MIELVVFYVHVVALATMFTKRWQEEGIVEGFLVVFFMGLIFFVGWSITSFLLKLMMEKEGIIRGLLDRDAASLLLLTAGESVLYYFYLRDEQRGGTNKTTRLNEAEN